jgi:D-alanyl-D-alanine carboxypeptidase
MIILFLLLTFLNLSEKTNNDYVRKNIQTEVSKEFLLGKFNYKKDKRFVLVNNKWSDNKIYLQIQTYKAFIKMADAAKKDGIDLKIISGTRSFKEQKVIWEKKWKLKEKIYNKQTEITLNILTYSAMPGSSRHHWGTDIDINSVEIEYFEKEEGKKTYEWLLKNAPKYGFCQVYTNKKTTNREGYEEEKWHWSYMALSGLYLESYIKNIDYDDITGFLGYETAKDIDIIKKYVQGINKTCLN